MKIKTKFNVGDKVSHAGTNTVTKGTIKKIEIVYTVDVGKDYTWNFFEDELQSRKEPILTDKEREYLSSVIKPFRNRVKCIKKTDSVLINNEQYLFIGIKNAFEGFSLPHFKKGAMYKGMKADKEYTIKELGL